MDGSCLVSRGEEISGLLSLRRDSCVWLSPISTFSTRWMPSRSYYPKNSIHIFEIEESRAKTSVYPKNGCDIKIWYSFRPFLVSFEAIWKWVTSILTNKSIWILWSSKFMCLGSRKCHSKITNSHKYQSGWNGSLPLPIGGPLPLRKVKDDVLWVYVVMDPVWVVDGSQCLEKDEGNLQLVFSVLL